MRHPTVLLFVSCVGAFPVWATMPVAFRQRTGLAACGLLQGCQRWPFVLSATGGSIQIDDVQHALRAWLAASAIRN